MSSFPGATITDRRERPSHGYRAAHVIVDVKDRAVEIQVRTELQQLWAAWSEALGSAVDQSIKYGGGPAQIRQVLILESERISLLESDQRACGGGLEDLAWRTREVKGRITSEILELEAKARNRDFPC